jgi:acetyltransferase-like isoleucine patch superfamily enzyme
MGAFRNAIANPRRAWRLWRVRRRGILIGPNCLIADAVRLDRGPYVDQLGTIEIGSNAQFDFGVVLQAWGGSIRCGDNVFFGPHTVVYGHGGVTIGDNTLVAMHCCIISSNHSIPPRARKIRYEPSELLSVSIGKDVWLAAGVKVLGGVTIGDGCIVGAGAVVTKDLPAYSIAHGVPAKVVGIRA